MQTVVCGENHTPLKQKPSMDRRIVRPETQSEFLKGYGRLIGIVGACSRIHYQLAEATPFPQFKPKLGVHRFKTSDLPFLILQSSFHVRSCQAVAREHTSYKAAISLPKEQISFAFRRFEDMKFSHHRAPGHQKR
jgi:hypothetical protein